MYLRPQSVDEALAFLSAEAGARVVAGGTDFYPALGDGPAPRAILDLTRVAGLRAVQADERSVRIGAGATWTDVLRADLPHAFDGLKAAAREIGATQIQNAATLAGNIVNASPAADGVPPLLTLGALVEVAGRGGRRSVPLAEFILGVRTVALRPGEVVTAITVPAQPPDVRGAFLKLGSRRSLVIAIVSVAALARAEGGRIGSAAIAVGAASPVAQRLPALEDALVGRTAEEVARLPVDPAFLAPLSPIDDVRGSAAYRMRAVAELCRRAVLAAAAPR